MTFHWQAATRSRVLSSPAMPLIRPTMPELDVVRGIAVTMVVVYHAYYWSADISRVSGATLLTLQALRPGWLGVNLFFVLSGFLITGILIDTRDRDDYYKRFYTRRALRILPAYVLLLTVLAASGIAHASFIIASLLFVANCATTLGVPMDYGPLWSLGVEEQFYLVWPFVVRNTSRRLLGIVSATIIVTTPVVRFIAFKHGITDDLYMHTWYVADGLAVGGLLAIFARSPLGTRRHLLGACLLTTLMVSIALAVGIPHGILHRAEALGAAFQILPWDLLFGSMLGITLLIGTSSWQRLVSIPAFAYLGRISYGLYLSHLLLFKVYDSLITRYSVIALSYRTSLPALTIRFVVAGTAAIVVSAVSRRYFEEFFLRLARPVKGNSLKRHQTGDTVRRDLQRQSAATEC